MARKMERTTDQAKLARYLSAGIHETADYAMRAAEVNDPRRMRNILAALQGQLQNIHAQTQEAIDAIDEARQFGGLPEWDVALETQKSPPSEPHEETQKRG